MCIDHHHEPLACLSISNQFIGQLVLFIPSRVNYDVAERRHLLRGESIFVDLGTFIILIFVSLVLLAVYPLDKEGASAFSRLITVSA
jgi:hypothetical protein